MFDRKTLMKLIGYRGNHPYQTEDEIYEDSQNIFNERQKNWLDYIKEIKPEVSEEEWGAEC